MTYIEYIKKRIEEAKEGEPIYIGKIAENLAQHFDMERDAAKAAASVAIKRIMDGEVIEDLKLYKKGIYYKAKLDIDRLIIDKYTDNYSGYEGPLTLLYKLGIIHEAPKDIVIVSNKVKDFARKDRHLGITITPPKTEINMNNYMYLQLLDCIEKIEKINADADDPEKILWAFIQRKRMNLVKLLTYADRYYNKATVLRLAHVVAENGDVKS